jgi:hypothetical protein
MENIGIVYGRLEYLTAIWYTYLMAFRSILCSFGIILPILVGC